MLLLVTVAAHCWFCWFELLRMFRSIRTELAYERKKSGSRVFAQWSRKLFDVICRSYKCRKLGKNIGGKNHIDHSIQTIGIIHVHCFYRLKCRKNYIFLSCAALFLSFSLSLSFYQFFFHNIRLQLKKMSNTSRYFELIWRIIAQTLMIQFLMRCMILFFRLLSPIVMADGDIVRALIFRFSLENEMATKRLNINITQFNC